MALMAVCLRHYATLSISPCHDAMLMLMLSPCHDAAAADAAADAFAAIVEAADIDDYALYCRLFSIFRAAADAADALPRC